MIQVNSITKSFGEVQALKGVSLDIPEGEIFGLLGPNGAGKSTCINIMSTLLQPDSGQVSIDGIKLNEKPGLAKLNIGVVPQEIALYEELSAWDNLMFWGGLYQIPKGELKQKARKVLEMVGLSDRKSDHIKTYSGGMKRRINIASSILHQPKVLLMDEPTVGVDPQSRNHVFEVIEQLNEAGMTIIYTTHYMEEAERLCDRIAIIDLGKIVAQGTLQELRANSGEKDMLTIELAKTSNMEGIESELSDSELDIEGRFVQISCSNIGKEISGHISRIQAAGGVIESIDTQKANLESVFLKLTGKQLRD